MKPKKSFFMRMWQSLEKLGDLPPQYYRWFAMGLTAVLGFYNIGKESYWFDEAFTVYVTKHLPVLVETMKQDFNMWLYYALLIPWERIFGYTETATRSLSVVLAVGTVFMLFRITERLKPDAAKYLAIVAPINISIIQYSQDTRAYTLTMFLASVAVYLAIRLEHTPTQRLRIPFVLTILLMFYSQVLTGFVYGALLLYFIMKRQWWVFWTVPILMIGLLPMVRQMSYLSGVGTYWSYPLSLQSFIELGYALFNGRASLITAVTLLLGFPYTRGRQYRILYYWIGTYISAVVVFAAFGKSFLNFRYLTPIVPPVLLLVAIALSTIRSSALRLVLIGGMFMLSVPRIAGYYIVTEKEQWRDVMLAVCRDPRNPAVLPYPYFGKLPLLVYAELYCPERSDRIIDIAPRPYFLGGSAFVDRPDPQEVHRICEAEPNVVVVVRNQKSRMFGWELSSADIQDPLRECYTEGKPTTYVGLTVIPYDRSFAFED